MSEVTSIGCSVPDTDEQMNLIDYETNLENELRRKIQLLKQKYELIEATEPESYTKNWFDELKKVLPLSILSLIEKSDDLDYKIKNKKMHYLDLIKELKLFKKKQDETLLYLVKDVAKHEAELNELQRKLLLVENYTDHENDENDENLDLIHDRATKIFLLVKKDLHFVLNTFHDAHMEDLIRNLTINYFKGGEEQYVELTPQQLRAYTTLKEAELVVNHPTDYIKIKFDKFT